MIRLKCLILTTALLLPVITRAQGVDKDLWNQAEKAYLSNDVQRLKECLGIIEERLDNPKLDYHYEKLLGNLYYCLTDYTDTCYNASLRHYNNAYELCHLSNHNAVIQLEIAQLLYKQKRFKEALPYLNKANFTLQEATIPYALCLAQAADSEEDFEEALRLLEEVALGNKGESVQDIYRAKAKVLLLKAEAGYSSDVKEATVLLSEYLSFQKQFLAETFSRMTTAERENYWMRHRQFIVDTYRLENNAPELLYDVALFSKNLLLRFSQKNDDYRNVTWEDIRHSLPPKSCAIEFVQYEKSGISMMAALVIRKDLKTPLFVEIGDVEDILSFKIADGVYSVEEAIKRDAPKPQYHNYKNNLYNNAELKSFLWPKELLESINGMKEVFFSPDGVFHQLAIEYLFPRKKAPKFHRLTSTESLIRIPEYQISLSTSSALIIGNVDIVGDSNTISSDNNDEDAFLRIKSQRITFKNLRKTEEEDIYRSRHNSSDTLVTLNGASESYFREHSSDYQIIHISTHGYFSGDLNATYNELLPCGKDATLSSSVLILGGSTANLRDSGFDAATHYDGILSAREISNLNLSNVRLCTLAACQTALGYVTGDGVYGIQRGLKNAGCGAIIMSLWSVNSEATRILMVSFYQYIEKGLSIRDAFYRARKDLMSTPDFKDPFFSNAFILVDDI